MKNETNIFESVCERSAEILPYLYKEVSGAERDGFDAHLAECTGCRDEFAAISFSRYSVYEWQREEFAPLATPDLASAFAPKAAESVRAGWLGGIREWFALPQRLAFAGGFAAIAVGFIAGVAYFSSPDHVSTGDIVKENMPAISQPAIERETAPTPEVTLAPVASPEPARAAEVVRTDAKPINRKTAVKRATVGRKPPENVVATVQPADLPRLTADDDDLDYGLRLADLVADIESRED
jgi:hypothetical protein